MIMQAQRPLIMIGAAASRPRSTSDLAQFVIRTRIPYFTTQMGKGTVPGGTELYMGTAALSERDYLHEAIEKADLVIAIGHDTVEKPPFIMGPRGPQVIHVGYLPANVEQVYFPQAEVIGDLGPSLRLLAERLKVAYPMRRPCCRCVKAYSAASPRARRKIGSPRKDWCTTFARSCRPTASWLSTTACTRSGLREIIVPRSQIRCCWTMPSPPWAPASPPPSRGHALSRPTRHGRLR
jgi:thiamine pyrophosphate-dependent acetolactate synthase large subunit-like protein